MRERACPYLLVLPKEGARPRLPAGPVLVEDREATAEGLRGLEDDRPLSVFIHALGDMLSAGTSTWRPITRQKQ